MFPNLRLPVSPKMRLHPFSVSFFLFTIIVHVPRVVCQDNEQYVNCSTHVECGNMEIGFPFWGGNRPDYCGHPDYELKCDGDAPEFSMKDVTYRFLQIHNTTRTVTVARADFWNDYCPETYVDTALNETLFTYNTTYPNLTLNYDCSSSSANQALSSVPNAFNCSDITGYFVATAVSIDIGLVTCKYAVKVPITQSAEEAINGIVLTTSQTSARALLGAALNGGFGLEWTAEDSLCENCVESGGQCGYNLTSSKFACYCPDMPYPSTCQNSSNGSNTGMKVVIGISASVGVILIVFAIIYGRRRKHYSSGTTFGFLKKKGKLKDDQNVEAFMRTYGSLAPKRFNYSDVKKMTNSFADKLGEGGFGRVYKGKLPDGRVVAVKVLNELKATGDEFINEVASISTTSHVNVVMLIGFCYEGAKRALIYEFMSNGSLDKYMPDAGFLDAKLQLPWRTMYEIAVGIGRGLEYLHRGCQTRILHLDIKPHNILLDQDLCPKISDFGLAKLCQRTQSMISMTGARGTVGYMAPEVYCRNFGRVSHKSDVYSYGMLLLAMAGERKNCGAAGSSDMYFPDWIYKRLEEGNDVFLERVMIEEGEEIARKMILVSLWCIQTNPLDRPSMGKVLEMLEGSLQAILTPPKPFLYSPPLSPQHSSTTSSLLP